MANWNGPNFRVDALLGRYRDYSPESLYVSDRRADCPGVHSGLDRRIQPIARQLGLGYGTEGIWPGHSGGHDAEAHFRPGPVSVHRVMGGVAAYLLIGLTWAFGYKLLMQERPDAIYFQSSFAFAGTPTGLATIPTGEPSRLIYFSFATLTSVSYGDAYPIHRVARSLAMAEALIGQLYPAILIATLVGMTLQARSSAEM